MEYSWAFAECLEPPRVLVTGSSMGKYAGLFYANLEGDLLSKPSAIMSRYMPWETVVVTAADNAIFVVVFVLVVVAFLLVHLFCE